MANDFDRLMSQYNEPVRSWPGEEVRDKALDEEAIQAAKAAGMYQVPETGVNRDSILPVAYDINNGVRSQSGQFAWPGMLKDMGHAVEAVGSAPLFGPIQRPSKMGQEAIDEMLGHAGAWVGPQGAGFPLGAARAALTHAPAGTFDVGMFGGRRGAEALAAKGEPRPLQALDMLERMEKEGRSREEIFAETNKLLEGTPYAGAFRGADKKPRFEMDDSGTSWNPREMNELSPPIAKLPEHLSHERLFEAYPGARETDVLKDSQGEGSWIGSWGTGDPHGAIMGINPDALDPRSVALHEAQHGIQRAEGFSTGATPRQFREMRDDAKSQLDAVMQNLHSFRRRAEEARNSGDATMETYFNRMLEEQRQLRDELYPQTQMSPFEMYKRVAGETEARTVQKRQDLTPEERRSRAPWLDYDVPESQQIVRFDGDGPQLSFAGPKAKTADHAALARAEEMAAAGLPREQIWNETGWFQGADGKWRFEIGDADSKYVGKFAGKGVSDQMGRLVEHPDLYEAYPDLASIKGVAYRNSADPMHGGYEPPGRFKEEISLAAPSVDEMRSGMLHELQHAIQEREQFAKGGNEVSALLAAGDKDFASIKAEYDAYQKGIDRTQQMRDEIGRLTDDRSSYTMLGSMKPEVKSRIDSLWGEIAATDPLRKGELPPDAMHEFYRRLSGETEARAVQARKDMTPEERRSRAPWLDYDIPEEKQIVRMGGGVQKSIPDSLPMDEASRLARAREMGFDTDRVAYRGLTKPYDENNVGYYQMFTSSPAEAGEYAMGNPLARPNVVPAYLRKGNNLEVDAMGRNFNSIPTDGLPAPIRARLGSVARTDEIAHAARELGYDSATIKNVIDNATNEVIASVRKNPQMEAKRAAELDALLAELGIEDVAATAAHAPPRELGYEGVQPHERGPVTIDAIFDPSNIRSTRAAFDPSKSSSPNLLAADTVAPQGVNVFKRGELPMDTASRMERAKGLGFDTDRTWYHGTTHNIDAFKRGVGNPEGHLGKSIYMTSEPMDASKNYAGLGPDLTNRIENLAEQVMSTKGWDEHGWGTPEYKAAYDRALAIAREKVAGPHDGAVMPLVTKGDKILDMTDGGTWLDFSPKMDKQGEIVGDSPLATKLYKSLQKQAEKYHDLDPDRVLGDLGDTIYGEVRAKDLDAALRASEGLMYATDNKGAMVSPDIIRQVYQDMGYRGALIDANAAFPHMDMPSGTQHLMMFNPKDIRSTQAAFDPAKASSANLLAAHASPAPVVRDEDDRLASAKLALERAIPRPGARNANEILDRYSKD